MAPVANPILLDTNVILECHRVGAWRAMHRYKLQTVEKCIEETHTGHQNRRPEQQIDVQALCADFDRIFAVSQNDLAQAVTREPSIRGLDDGELYLWAHALTRADVWYLCGPDKASMRIGVKLGLRDRLLSLEKLLADIGHRPKLGLGPGYTTKWLNDTLSQFVILDGGGNR